MATFRAGGVLGLEDPDSMGRKEKTFQRKPPRVSNMIFFSQEKQQKAPKPQFKNIYLGVYWKRQLCEHSFPLQPWLLRSCCWKADLIFKGNPTKDEKGVHFFFTENLPQGGKKKPQQPEEASWKCEQLGQFLRKHGWCWQEMLGGMQDWLHILPWSRTEQRDQCEKPLLGSTFPFDFG